MEGPRFDALTRWFGKRTSRRQLFAPLGGLMAGTLVGAHPAAAVICRQGGVLCAKDAQCCSGSCVSYHCACLQGQVSCGPRCCAAGQVCTDATCCTPDSDATTCNGKCGPQTNNCGQAVDCGSCCTPDCTGKCTGGSDGCGGTCTGSCGTCETCSGGTCTPVACTASDQCHVAGTCDTGTGMCSNPTAPNGTSCSFTNFGISATGECESGTCVCRPSGTTCNILDPQDCCSGCCELVDLNNLIYHCC